MWRLTAGRRHSWPVRRRGGGYPTSPISSCHSAGLVAKSATLIGVAEFDAMADFALSRLLLIIRPDDDPPVRSRLLGPH